MGGEDVGVEDVGVERLLRLLWLFRREGTVRTSDEIEACGYPDVHHESSAGRKNFQNDRARLRSLGIELGRTNDDAWRVESIADALDAHLDDDERAALTEAELLLAASNPSGSTARRHVGPPHAALLLSATIDGHVVEFDYDGARRRVRPLRLSISNQDRWYLHAHDTATGEQRTFRLDRFGPTLTIDRAAVAASARPTPSPSTHPSTWSVDPPIDAVIRFAHEPLPEWMAMLGPARTPVGPTVEPGHQPTQQQTLQRTWTTTNHVAFVSRVLAIGPAAEIIEPPALVELARAMIRAHMISPAAAASG